MFYCIVSHETSLITWENNDNLTFLYNSFTYNYCKLKIHKNLSFYIKHSNVSHKTKRLVLKKKRHPKHL